MVNRENMLGDYLRAQRERTKPEHVGLPTQRNRRVPGLRRAEVALLADISADYYLRLEQGRDRRPSAQVLHALSDVFKLDAIGTTYLLSLAEQKDDRLRRHPKREVVPESIATMLSTINLPAFVEGRYLDVLAANPLATAISPELTVGKNRLLSVFLDPGEQQLYTDWEDTTARLVAGFRRSVGTDTLNNRFIDLVGELSLASERFRTLWARQDVQPRQNWRFTIEHPLVGEMTLLREKLVVGDTDRGLMLAIYHSEPGSTDAEKLQVLTSTACPA
ncbi:helix-turn-helix domain-containing protein [Brevibacterium marinum]|uniref:Transcriptional regulator with XRE-family HTH domain n=1 Tax=Brevibacterium marinum TaxID=418643 RepID=A0A846RVY7_9MICO|nr:helix-turn-helix transcriptional regulator [Brevibacterium marinum]NJC56126.1 transcriptional regulator with XRE-family HTH domain [Brevibacterium marinum]